MKPETAAKLGPLALGLGLLGVLVTACLFVSPGFVAALPYWLDPEAAQAQLEAGSAPLAGLVIAMEIADLVCCFVTWPLLMAGGVMVMIGRQRR